VLKQPGYDDGSAGPVLVRSVVTHVEMAELMGRLAWHASGTFSIVEVSRTGPRWHSELTGQHNGGSNGLVALDRSAPSANDQRRHEISSRGQPACNVSWVELMSSPSILQMLVCITPSPSSCLSKPPTPGSLTRIYGVSWPPLFLAKPKNPADVSPGRHHRYRSYGWPPYPMGTRTYRLRQWRSG